MIDVASIEMIDILDDPYAVIPEAFDDDLGGAEEREASLERYHDLAREELRATFPNAMIGLCWGNDFKVIVPGINPEDEEEVALIVGEIMSRVFNAGGW